MAFLRTALTIAVSTALSASAATTTKVETPLSTSEITFPVSVGKISGGKYTLWRTYSVGNRMYKQISAAQHWSQGVEYDDFLLPAGCYSLESFSVADINMTANAFKWNVTGTTIDAEVYDQAFFGVGGALCDLPSSYGCLKNREDHALACWNYDDVLLTGSCHYSRSDSRYTDVVAACSMSFANPTLVASSTFSFSLLYNTMDMTDLDATYTALRTQLGKYLGIDGSRLTVTASKVTNAAHEDEKLGAPIRVVVEVSGVNDGDITNFVRLLREPQATNYDAEYGLPELTTGPNFSNSYKADVKPSPNVPGLDDSILLGVGIIIESDNIPIPAETQKLLDDLLAGKKTEDEVVDEVNDNNGLSTPTPSPSTGSNKDPNCDKSTDDTCVESDDSTQGKGKTSSSSSKKDGFPTVAIAVIAAAGGVLMLGAGLVAYRRRKATTKPKAAAAGGPPLA